jgi:hypothetical protein
MRAAIYTRPVMPPALRAIIAFVVVSALGGCSTENDPNGPAWSRFRCDVQMYGSTFPMLISYREQPARASLNEKLVDDVQLSAVNVTIRDGDTSLKIEKATNELTIHIPARESSRETRLPEVEFRGTCTTIARHDMALINQDLKKYFLEVLSPRK